MKLGHLSFGLALTGLAAMPIAADDAQSNLQAFKACAEIASNTERLACFDKAASVFDFERATARLKEADKLKAETERLKAVAATERAEAERLRVAADKEAKRLRAEAEREKAEKEAVIAAEEQRQADLAALALEEFGQRGATDGGFNTIHSSIVATKRSAIGDLYIKLENGHIWQNVDDSKPGRIKPGMAVRIHETDIGGLFMTVDETGKTFRVKRVN
ncbi:type VI secretion protein [Kordiimonas aestuarii]|uniref:type VI secretion protein n=1 Tax=Kordiimonas aestuarii TaxID=1005925 RepID=UPI0021D1B31D|nr:type VI secretion protein [Kordiimonas aestuarii]